MTSRQLLQTAIIKVQRLMTSTTSVEPAWLKGILPPVLVLLQQGLATMSGEEGSQIDSGTRQSIAIAKSILAEREMK
jgi:ABC-type transport system involved in Fe-S cluster assembly fused permease/ATPase subunit